MSNPLFSERAFPAAASLFSRTATVWLYLEQREGYQMCRACLRRCAGRTIRREGRAAWALQTGHASILSTVVSPSCGAEINNRTGKGETMRFRSFLHFYDISNELRSISRDTNLTPKVHIPSAIPLRPLLRTENVNVGVVCCRNIRMAKPLC